MVLTKSHGFVRKENASSKGDFASKEELKKPEAEGEAHSAYGMGDSKNSSVVKLNIKAEGLTNISFTNSKIHVRDELHDDDPNQMISTQRISKRDKNSPTKRSSHGNSPIQIKESLYEDIYD